MIVFLRARRAGPGVDRARRHGGPADLAIGAAAALPVLVTGMVLGARRFAWRRAGITGASHCGCWRSGNRRTGAIDLSRLDRAPRPRRARLCWLQVRRRVGGIIERKWWSVAIVLAGLVLVHRSCVRSCRRRGNGGSVRRRRWMRRPWGAPCTRGPVHHRVATQPLNLSIHVRSGLHRVMAGPIREAHPGLKREIVGGHSLLFTWRGAMRPPPGAAHRSLRRGAGAAGYPPPGSTSLRRRDRRRPAYMGRGTLDDKSAVIAIMEGGRAPRAQGHKPRATLYLSFGHDEELGGEG